MTDLFTPLKLGPLELPNRVLMAPLTRCRAEPDHVPGPLMATYYRQRAGAGLLIAEATMVMEGHSAFWREPGIHSPAQVEGWRLTTEAVHGAGGRIVLQLWHGGRACHPLLNEGRRPVAPSPIAITGDEVHTPEGKQPYVVPRELADAELPGIVEGFRLAARNAIAAGFDGVEVHGANGYLLDEFLRDGSNRRRGPYGGPIAHRARLLLEVLDAVRQEAELVGLRISPLNGYNAMEDSDPIGLACWLADHLEGTGLTYLHLMRGDFLGQQHGDVLTPVRRAVLRGPGGQHGLHRPPRRTPPSPPAPSMRWRSATPSWPTRTCPSGSAAAPPCRNPDPSTYYTPGAAGYTDYPFLTPA